MIDQYGNYFCQTLLKTADSENRLEIIKMLGKEFVKVSCHSVGTHSMQRLLEILTSPQEKEVVFNSTKDHFQEMARHNNGNYVLASFFNLFEHSHVEVMV